MIYKNTDFTPHYYRLGRAETILVNRLNLMLIGVFFANVLIVL